MHEADQESERDQVQVGTAPLCWLILTSSMVASLSDVMVQKSLGYEPKISQGLKSMLLVGVATSENKEIGGVVGRQQWG